MNGKLLTKKPIPSVETCVEACVETCVEACGPPLHPHFVKKLFPM